MKELAQAEALEKVAAEVALDDCWNYSQCESEWSEMFPMEVESL